MIVICAFDKVLDKYGAADGACVLDAVRELGRVVDVSGLDNGQIKATIAQQPGKPDEPVCLIGGYGLLPNFLRRNPSAGLISDRDREIATDGPYGAVPGRPAQEFLPTRPVARIPDADTADASAFIQLLTHQAAVKTVATPGGSFEQAAAEFVGAARHVHRFMAANGPDPRLSPLDDIDTPGIDALISGKGRIHILLHGADFEPSWGTLWGHADGATDYPATLSAGRLRQCNLTGAVVSFSSCYSAMLDITRAGNGPRTTDNQVALACLAAGAKVVYGWTRANWIDIADPFDAFGSALIAHVWRQLKGGEPAAEALRIAKMVYTKEALQADPLSRPYVLKTVLQAQCYGNPEATL